MNLAIADPPYLGRGARLYGPGANGARSMWTWGPSTKTWAQKVLNTTEHPDAAEWDDPARHWQLIRELDTSFDGWALAAAQDSLHVLLPAAPRTRIAVWVKPNPVPGGSRIITAWEPVILRVPDGRKHNRVVGNGIRDVLTCPTPNVGHVGAKPRAWTRWVLDMMGYEDGDVVTDMFPGSGAVAAEIAQGVLPL